MWWNKANENTAVVGTCNLSQISLLFSCIVLLCSPYFCEIRLNTHTRKGVTSSITNELRRTRLMSDDMRDDGTTLTETLRIIMINQASTDRYSYICWRRSGTRLRIQEIRQHAVRQQLASTAVLTVLLFGSSVGSIYLSWTICDPLSHESQLSLSSQPANYWKLKGSLEP